MWTAVIREWLYLLLPKPRTRCFSNTRSPEIKRVIVLSNGINPTFAHYLEARLEHLSLPVHVFDVRQSLSGIDANGTFVILCRYAWLMQLLWLFAWRNRLAGCALLIDDDLAATVSDVEYHWIYRLYVMVRGLLPLPLLNCVLTDIWASTSALANVLKTRQVVEPIPPKNAYINKVNIADTRETVVRIAYHSRGAHEVEHDFLIPVLERVSIQHPDVLIQIVAEGRVAKKWQKSRISTSSLQIVPPLSWSAYLETTRNRPIDIVLVPLMRSRMNDVRADTKRVDVCRMAAAGVFSDVPVYASRKTKGEVLVANNAEQWVEIINRLISDAALRADARSATELAVSDMANANSTLPGLEQWHK